MFYKVLVIKAPDPYWIRIKWMRIRNPARNSEKNGPGWACSPRAAGQRRVHRPDICWLEAAAGVHSGPTGTPGRLLARRRVLQAPVCCGSMKFLVWIRIRGSIGTSVSWIRILILLFSSVTFKTSTKNYFFLSKFFAYYFLPGGEYSRHQCVADPWISLLWIRIRILGSIGTSD